MMADWDGLLEDDYDPDDKRRSFTIYCDLIAQFRDQVYPHGLPKHIDINLICGFLQWSEIPTLEAKSRFNWDTHAAWVYSHKRLTTLSRHKVDNEDDKWNEIRGIGANPRRKISTLVPTPELTLTLHIIRFARDGPGPVQGPISKEWATAELDWLLDDPSTRALPWFWVGWAPSSSQASHSNQYAWKDMYIDDTSLPIVKRRRLYDLNKQFHSANTSKEETPRTGEVSQLSSDPAAQKSSSSGKVSVSVHPVISNPARSTGSSSTKEEHSSKDAGRLDNGPAQSSIDRHPQVAAHEAESEAAKEENAKLKAENEEAQKSIEELRAESGALKDEVKALKVQEVKESASKTAAQSSSVPGISTQTHGLNHSATPTQYPAYHTQPPPFGLWSLYPTMPQQFVYTPYGNQMPTTPGQAPAAAAPGYVHPLMYMPYFGWQQNAGPLSGAISPARQEEMAQQQKGMREKAREAHDNDGEERRCDGGGNDKGKENASWALGNPKSLEGAVCGSPCLGIRVWNI